MILLFSVLLGRDIIEVFNLAAIQQPASVILIRYLMIWCFRHIANLLHRYNDILVSNSLLLSVVKLLFFELLQVFGFVDEQ